MLLFFTTTYQKSVSITIHEKLKKDETRGKGKDPGLCQSLPKADQTQRSLQSDITGRLELFNNDSRLRDNSTNLSGSL